MKDPWFPLLLDLLDKWQNLTAAAIAIFAAALAYRSAIQQIRQNERQEHNRRSKKHASIRAMLPLALSQVTEYAQNSANALTPLIPLCQNETFPRNSSINDLPRPLPHDTLKALAEFIEYSDDINASLVEVMVAWIQIHDARVRSLIRRNQDPAGTAFVARREIEGSIIDAASIYAAANALFNYGRRREPQLPTNITWENVRGAFRSMRLWDQDHPDLWKIVEEREKKCSGPFCRLAQ